MSNWEKVTQDKELLSKVEDWVRGLSIDSPQEVFDEMNRLTGNDWSREQYESHIFDYPDFYDWEEVVYALFHDGHYPERKSEDLEAWKIEESVDDDKDVRSFFIHSEYKKNRKKCSRYDEIDVKKLYRDLLEVFPRWNEDADSYEKLFCLKNKEIFGFTKTIFISNVYDRKFLDCTLTNMNQEEKDTFVNVVRKYCNHVVREEIHPHNTATYKMRFMFDWRSGVCLWADNEAAKSKFNGYPVETCDLPISDGLKATLEDLICLYDEAFDFEESNGDLLWDKNQIEEFLCTAREAYACLCEELGPEYEVELGLDDFDDVLAKGPSGNTLTITLEDGEINIQGTINLGYIGTFTDEEIEINDTLEEIREWDIVQDNLDEDCSEEELIAFLNRYFNEFADKITRNIDNINGTFLLQTLTDMDCNEIDFMVIDELFLEDKLPYGNEEDIAELYNFAHDGLRSLIPYLESPNDGCIPKGHIEALLRSFFPAFDFDCFIANIVPEVVTLCDGSIAFQCSDAFDEAILCGAYAELDEELCFTDWHNF